MIKPITLSKIFGTALVAGSVLCLAHQRVYPTLPSSAPTPYIPTTITPALVPAPPVEIQESNLKRKTLAPEKTIEEIIIENLPIDWKDLNKHERWGVWLGLKKKYTQPIVPNNPSQNYTN